MKYFVISAFVVSVLASCSTAPATEISGSDSIAVDSIDPGKCTEMDSVCMMPDSIKAMMDTVK